MKTLNAPSTKQFWFAVILVIFGCAMLTAAFIVNPTGEIHGSVLGAFGEILSFAGACLGFDYYNRKTYLTIAERHQDNKDDGSQQYEPETPTQSQPDNGPEQIF